jgi:hypothetical protein
MKSIIIYAIVGAVSFTSGVYFERHTAPKPEPRTIIKVVPEKFPAEVKCVDRAGPLKQCVAWRYYPPKGDER